MEAHGIGLKRCREGAEELPGQCQLARHGAGPERAVEGLKWGAGAGG